MIAPAGFLMGIPFPTGLTRLESSFPQAVRWAWALNAAASVLGSVCRHLSGHLYWFARHCIDGRVVVFMRAFGGVGCERLRSAASAAGRSRSSFMKFTVILHSLVASCASDPACAASSLDPPKLRLDGSAQPFSYAVDLTIVPDRDTFRGIVDISVDIRTPADVMWLNSVGLQIQDATFRPESGARTAGQDRAGWRPVYRLCLRSPDFRPRRSARRLSGQDQPEQQRGCFPIEGRPRVVRLQPIRTHRCPPRVSLFR